MYGDRHISPPEHAVRMNIIAISSHKHNLRYLSEPAACGSILTFRTIMTLKNEIGAALRAVRQQRGLSYEELNDSTFRTTVSSIERGKSKLTIEKLSSLAKALDFDLLAFMAMCIALERGQTPDDAIVAAQRELDRFKAAGGLALLQEQIVEGELVSRSQGKPANFENKNAVLQLKAEGKTQAEIRRLLGLSKSTVSQYWHSKS